MSSLGGTYSPLWITRLTRYSGIEKLAKYTSRPELGPYIFVFLLAAIDVGVLSTVGYLAFDRTHPLLENPFWYLAPIGLWFCVWVIRFFARKGVELANTYDSDMFSSPNVSENGFYDIRRTWVKHSMYALLLAVHATNYILLGEWHAVAQLEGPVIGFIKFAIIIPFGYFPVIAEISGIALTAFVVVPRYFVTNEYNLQFDDPLNIGGLKKVGDLMKSAFYVYSFGLLVLLAWVYGPFVFSAIANNPYPGPGTNRGVQFILAWVLGIAFLLYGVFKLHFYMQEQKEEKIKTIDAQIRDLGNDQKGVPGTELDPEDVSKLEVLHRGLEEVRQTKTWPFSAKAQEQVIFSALLPIGLERLIAIIWI